MKLSLRLFDGLFNAHFCVARDSQLLDSYGIVASNPTMAVSFINKGEAEKFAAKSGGEVISPNDWGIDPEDWSLYQLDEDATGCKWE